jgi:glycerol uptake facilitator-like aquaporin
MSLRKYAAELAGTFTLTTVVWLATTYAIPLPVPFAVALTLGLFVYLVGPISGAHLNPAVTLGLLSVGKMKTNEAIFYIASQIAGAVIAMGMCALLSPDAAPAIIIESTFTGAFVEMLGAFILAFAVTSVAMHQVPAPAAGIVVGGALLVGVLIASPFRDAILNPAVALGIRALGPFEILAPIVGAVAGSWARTALDA